jgi:hypothetical protein
MRDFFRWIDGPDLNTVVSSGTSPVLLDEYLPTIRHRTSLSGHLTEQTYAVRAGTVIQKRGVLLASDLKRTVGLHPETKVLLLLFDSDEIIEQVFRRAGVLLPKLAAAGYDAVTAPSYSCWWPRPRAEHLYNLKRSLWVYGALQRFGIPAVPRVAWFASPDVSRFAAWVRANPIVESVALDLMTYRARAWWSDQMEGLDRFDQATGGRLRYLINGPSKRDRFADVFSIVGRGRVTFTNGAIARPPRNAKGTSSTISTGQRFQQEIVRDRWEIELGARACQLPALPPPRRVDEAA